MMIRPLCLVLLALFTFNLLVPLAHGKARARKHKKPRYASIVIDARTGRVFHQVGSRMQVYPASLTKMMTLYMVFDALKRKKLSRFQRVRVSRHAARQEPSNIKLKAGERITIEQAIVSLVCRSANDSAVVLAEAVGGSEARFARLMTQKARQLGLRHTTFRNASGLFHPKQTTTAHDMAQLAVHLIRHFPREYKYFKRRQFTFKGKLYKTHNRLVGRIRGVDGLKTGYIRRSGFNLVTSAQRSGRRLVAVVMGGKTARWRDRHMTSLLDLGFVRCAKAMQRASPMKRRKIRAHKGRSQRKPDRLYIHTPARNIRKGPFLRAAKWTPVRHPIPQKKSPVKKGGLTLLSRRRSGTTPETIDDLLAF